MADRPMADKAPASGTERTIEFDAADLADAILGESEAAPKADERSLPQRPDFLGPILLMLLGLAVTLAIGLALQFNNNRSSPQQPRCDGLYASLYEECMPDCDSDPVRDADGGRGDGLFDAEERFAGDSLDC